MAHYICKRRDSHHCTWIITKPWTSFTTLCSSSIDLNSSFPVCHHNIYFVTTVQPLGDKKDFDADYKSKWWWLCWYNCFPPQYILDAVISEIIHVLYFFEGLLRFKSCHRHILIRMTNVHRSNTFCWTLYNIFSTQLTWCGLLIIPYFNKLQFKH